MATYYVRADGTAANKAAATSDSSASTSMSIATHNSQSYSAGDVIVISDAGGVYRGTRLNPPSSGSNGSPIIYQENDGGSPLLKGSTDISTASYSWTLSSTGTNCYYCRTSGGGNPSLIDPGLDMVFLDDVSLEKGASVAALTDHQWYYGDADTLGYSTIYVRDDTGDPDTSGVLIEAAQIGCMYIYDKDYITVDGLEVRHGTETGDYIGGFLSTGGSTYIIVQNCEAHWNNGNGLCIKGHYCTIDNCTASYNGAHNISAGGFVGNHSTYMTLSNNTSHHCRTIGWSGGPYDGYGLKFLFVDNSSMFGNHAYSNDLQGINLDGSDADHEGSDSNEVYNNHVHDNAFQGILVEIYSDSNKVYHNLVYNNGSSYEYLDIGQYEIGITHRCTNNEVYGNLIYKNRGTVGNDTLLGIDEYQAGGGCSGTKVYGNTMLGFGYAKYGIYVDGYTSPENMSVKNNIVNGTTDECLYVQGTSFTGFTSDYNNFRRTPTNSTVVNRDYSGYTVGAAGTHYATFGQDYHSFTDDPQLHDPNNGDFTLDSDSPCIDTGVDLGLTYQNGLMPGSSWPDNVILADQESHEEV